MKQACSYRRTFTGGWGCLGSERLSLCLVLLILLKVRMPGSYSASLLAPGEISLGGQGREVADLTPKSRCTVLVGTGSMTAVGLFQKATQVRLVLFSYSLLLCIDSSVEFIIRQHLVILITTSYRDSNLSSLAI